MMVYYLIVFLCALLFTSGLLLLKFPFFSFSRATAAQLNVILDNTSDEAQKQKLLVRNLITLLIRFGIFIVLLFILIFISLAPFYLYLDYLAIEIRDADTSSIYFYLSMLIGGLFIFFIPLKKRSDYSDWSKLLHHMVLDNYNISGHLFSLENKKLQKRGVDVDGKYVIVTGLARAGTTALTNLLFQTGNFFSLSYANMPFLLAPNLWRKFYKPKNKKLKERAHGDSVLFGYDTIEALEEYYFKVFLKDQYISENSLKVHEIDDGIYQSYLNYHGIIRKNQSGTIYLAKNNNMILRLKSLRTFNNQFKAIVIIRNPMDHAQSLLNQHTRFTRMQSEDSFILDYMNWLGHHEFGLNHKVFDLGYQNTWDEFESTSLDYWLAVWINYHTYILSLLDDDCDLVIIDYSDLLNDPEGLLSNIGKSLELNISVPSQERFIKSESEMDMTGVSEVLVAKSGSLYSNLLYHKLKISG